jgi:membrane-associated phospholipid phosphatase
LALQRSVPAMVGSAVHRRFHAATLVPDSPATTPAAAAAPAWRTELFGRMRRLLWLKLAGTTAFTWVFFIGYFHLLRHPARPALPMPLTALDHAIPFQPSLLAAYVSLWLYVGVAPGLARSFTPLVVHGLWAAALCLAGLGLFYAFPTTVPPPAIDLGAHPAFAMLQGVDAAGNACPSLHVATAAFSAIWIDRLLGRIGTPAWLRWANGAWFVAIAYSTLAIKQHVVLDVAAGLLLGVAFAVVSLRFSPRP